MDGWIEKLHELSAADTPVAVVTVTKIIGSAPRETGAKMIVGREGRLFGTIGGGNLEAKAIDEARDTLEAGTARVTSYPLGAAVGQCCGGVVELLFEPLNAGPKLYLYGAGHVGTAVCQVLEGTDFRIHLVDERDEWLQGEGLPPRVMRHAEPWQDFNARASWSHRDVFTVVMTHRHDLDQEIVADLMRRSTRYVGLIGSDAKWQRFRLRLADRGFTEAELRGIRCPIGVGDFGKAPREVAISLAAELLALRHAKT